MQPVYNFYATGFITFLERVS